MKNSRKLVWFSLLPIIIVSGHQISKTNLNKLYGELSSEDKYKCELIKRCETKAAGSDGIFSYQEYIDYGKYFGFEGRVREGSEVSLRLIGEKTYVCGGRKGSPIRNKYSKEISVKQMEEYLANE